MKTKNIKKIIKCIVYVSILTLLLYLSMDNKSVIFTQEVYATQTDQSSTSTKKQTDQSSTKTTSGNMIELLAKLVYAEARGEPYRGQVAVAAVVMNRVKSSEFPNTISGVIYQKGQFSCVTDGQINLMVPKDASAYKAAQEAINGVDPTSGCIFFYNPKTTKSKWLYTRKTVITIGNHAFAR